MTRFMRVSAVAGLVLTGILGASAAWGGPNGGRVVVVTGTPQGQPVPVGPNEKATVVTVVVIRGVAMAIVRIEPMPVKPKFNIIDDKGVSHPYPPDSTDAHGCTTTHEVQVIQVRDAAGVHDEYQVVTRTTCGQGYAEVKTKYPPGSQYVPDPPQPPGTAIMAARVPADPATEADVLARLGLPNTLATEVWLVPSGELRFFHNAAPPTLPVRIRMSGRKADMNCDGVVNSFDIDPFVLALVDRLAYGAAFGQCDIYNADVNDDNLVDNFDIAPFVDCLVNGGCQ